MGIRGVLFLVVIILILNLGYVLSEIRINEIELNSLGTDTGAEWIELYSSSQIDLKDYYIENFDGDKLEFNESSSFKGYYIIELKKQWLDNVDEGIKLFKSSDNNKIDETKKLFDSANNDKTNQFCENGWIFVDETKGEDNNCPSNSNESSNDNSNNKEDENNDNDREDEETEQKEEDLEENNADNISNNINFDDKNDEIIVLTSKTIEAKGIKNPNNVVYMSKSEKIKRYITPILIVVCIFLVILLFMNRKKKE